MHKSCITLIVVLAAIILISVPLEAEEWVSYNPKSDDIAVNYFFSDNVSINITVTITFPHSGFTARWGSVEIYGDVARACIDVMMWTGPAAQVITHKAILGNYQVMLEYLNCTSTISWPRESSLV
ncbi:MAG: hypothetical protein QW701_01715 [Candidatus Nezhaarchaeales archaeon]